MKKGGRQVSWAHSLRRSGVAGMKAGSTGAMLRKSRNTFTSKVALLGVVKRGAPK